MNRTELIKMYPDCALDIAQAFPYGGTFTVQTEEVDDFWETIDSIERDFSYAEGELYEDRIGRILTALQSEPPRPIFIAAITWDGVSEGHHRLVAFHRLGMKTVTVVREMDEGELCG